MSERNERIFGLVVGLAIAALCVFAYVTFPVSPPTIDGHGTGYEPDAEAAESFLSELDKPNFSDAASGLFTEENRLPPEPRATDGVFLYRYEVEAWRRTNEKQPWPTPNQFQSSSCVGHGWARAISITTAIDFVKGETSEWFPADPISIYGGARVDAKGLRYAGGNGASGAMAGRFVINVGILPQVNYQWCDTTNRTSQAVVSRASEWGYYGNGGRRNEVQANEVCRQYPVKQVALVTTYKEAWTAIKNGYPVAVCSSQGFTDRRDANGFCDTIAKPWKHCMCFVGIRFDRPGLLCQNSWGSYVIGAKYPPDMPEGSFWVDEVTAGNMLQSYRDSYAVAGAYGFAAKELDNGEGL